MIPNENVGYTSGVLIDNVALFHADCDIKFLCACEKQFTSNNRPSLESEIVATSPWKASF